MTASGEDISVTRFREYLRIKTVQPNPDFATALDFLSKYAAEVGLQSKIVEPHPGQPFVIMTWPGKDPSLKSIILHSHMDVVPVFPEHWTHDPFSAHKDEKGDIYARGTQDMKSLGIQYVEAIRRLRQSGMKNCLRTIHITWSPDEELGGELGMKKFVNHESFLDLNHGFSLDEGIPTPDDTYKIMYAERCKWWLQVSCIGRPGHGSALMNNTAAEKMKRIVNSFLEFRESEKAKLEADKNLRIGNVVTVNLTKVHGGVQQNVVPAEILTNFDIRVPPTADKAALKAKFESFVTNAGEDVTHEWLLFDWVPNMTSTSDNDPWWKAFSGTLKNLNLKFHPEILQTGSDSMYLRQKGFPAIGFSPMIHTPNLLHDHNEFVNEKVYLEGVRIYTKLIPNLANVPKCSVDK